MAISLSERVDGIFQVQPEAQGEEKDVQRFRSDVRWFNHECGMKSR